MNELEIKFEQLREEGLYCGKGVPPSCNSIAGPKNIYGVHESIGIECYETYIDCACDKDGNYCVCRREYCRKARYENGKEYEECKEEYYDGERALDDAEWAGCFD